jgi:2OG-Fe(II) oxygenase superfamily
MGPSKAKRTSKRLAAPAGAAAAALAQQQIHEVWAPPLGPPPYRDGGKPAHAAWRLACRSIYKSNVHVVDDFLTASEAAAWIRFAEDTGFEEARHTATRHTAYRENGRIEHWDPNVAARIWARLRPLVPPVVDGWSACGAYEKIRLYRYAAGGQRFGKHVDESNPGERPGTRTALTVLIYLNGNCEGGETVFYRGVVGNSEAVRFRPTAGALLWHGHGQHCLVHEALPVSRGTKYILRTDVLYEQSSSYL